jgi:hypothetical protein
LVTYQEKQDIDYLKYYNYCLIMIAEVEKQKNKIIPEIFNLIFPNTNVLPLNNISPSIHRSLETMKNKIYSIEPSNLYKVPSKYEPASKELQPEFDYSSIYFQFSGKQIDKKDLFKFLF